MIGRNNLQKKVSSIYFTDRGESLVIEENYTEVIKEFLHKEKVILDSYAYIFSQLVEVGCMHGRYLEWAVVNQKSYLGIDIVENYINKANERIISNRLSPEKYKAIVESSENLDRNKYVQSDNSLLFFPFNSFGNMDNLDNTINSIILSRSKFIISSYLTDSKTNNARKDYYIKSGCKGIQMISEKNGIRFMSLDGLNSIAYHPEYLKDKFESTGINLELKIFSDIGISYINDNARIK